MLLQISLSSPIALFIVLFARDKAVSLFHKQIDFGSLKNYLPFRAQNFEFVRPDTQIDSKIYLLIRFERSRKGK